MNGGDFTRTTFDPTHHYSGVRMQQGRVQLDADWNEQLDIAAPSRSRRGRRHRRGHAARPSSTAASRC